MFTRAEFEQLLHAQDGAVLETRPYPGMYYVTYPQYAFITPDAEEFIRITRAPKASGDNGLRFWLEAEFLDDWRGRESYLLEYLTGARFDPVDACAFDELVVAQCSGLVVPPALPLAGGKAFVGALLMHSLRTELIVSAMAEYADEYVHFYWESTA